MKAELVKNGKIKEGFYPNNWVKLSNLWLTGRLPNLDVYDALANDLVPTWICLMPYEESLNTNAA